MNNIGSCFQLAGLLSGIAAVFFYAIGMRTGKGIYRSYGNIMRAVQLFAVGTASSLLLYAILSDDFSLRYTAIYGDRALPLLYKISVMWAGQSGALLTASLVFTFFGLFETWRIRNSEDKYACGVLLVNSVVSSIFLTLTVFVLNPFTQLDFTPVNGAGLEPVLQNIYIFLYPFLTCFWIGGAIILFSHLVATLSTKDLSPYWLKRVGGWVYFSWVAAACSIIAKSAWSYNVVGRFWNWNIQETVSAAALLTLTAFIHTSVVYETKGKMKLATIVYVFLFFEAALFSLYLIHSGTEDVVASYKYALCGVYLLAVMVITAALFIVTVIINRKDIYSDKQKVPVIKDLAFRVFNLIFAGLVFLMFAGILLQVLGMRGRTAEYYYLAVMVPAAVLFISVSLILEAAVFGKKARRSCIGLVRGGAAIHVGFALMCIGIALTAGFHSSGQIITNVNSNAKFGPYDIKIGEVKSAQRDNYVSTFVDISLSSNKKMLGNVYPEIRGYNNSNNLIAETKSLGAGIGIVSVAFLSYDFSSNEVRLLVMDYPFILLIAPGFLVLAFGMFKAARREGNN